MQKRRLLDAVSLFVRESKAQCPQGKVSSLRIQYQARGGSATLRFAHTETVETGDGVLLRQRGNAKNAALGSRFFDWFLPNFIYINNAG